MAKTIRLNGLEQDGAVMRADITAPDGSRHMHVFPVDTLEWRAAEYELDPSDLDTLLEIVLAEPFLDPDPDDPTLSLFDADTIKQARGHHLKKVRTVTVDRDPDAWERGKSGAVMSFEAIGLKWEHVQRGRTARKEQKKQPPHRIPDRIEALRAALDTRKVRHSA